MSHTRTVKVRGLGVVNPELVKQAMQILASEYGCEVVTEVTEYGGARHKVLVGMRGGAFKYGFGVQLDKAGRPTIIGDDYNAPVSIEDFTREFEQQAYPAVALSAAFNQELGMTVNVEKQGQRVVVVAQG